MDEALCPPEPSMVVLHTLHQQVTQSHLLQVPFPLNLLPDPGDVPYLTPPGLETAASSVVAADLQGNIQAGLKHDWLCSGVMSCGFSDDCLDSEISR